MRLLFTLGTALLAASLCGDRADAAMLLSAPAAGGGPVNTAAPTLTPTGTAAVGATLTCTAGTWTGTVSTHSYQFFRNGSTSVQGPSTPGAGTSTTYLVASGDAGGSLTCTDIAAGPGGSTTSPASTPVLVSGITYVNSADLGNNGGTTSSYTHAYTVGSGSNRFLFVGILGDVIGGADDVSGVTYAGTAMAQIAKWSAGVTSSSRVVYMFALAAPASGANNVVITASTNHYLIALAADYVGVIQTTPGCDGVGGNNVGAGTSMPLSFTTTAAGDWGLVYIDAGTGGLITIGSSYQKRVIDTAFGTNIIFDSGTSVPVGAQTVTLSSSTGQNMSGMICGIKKQ